MLQVSCSYFQNFQEKILLNISFPSHSNHAFFHSCFSSSSNLRAKYTWFSLLLIKGPLSPQVFLTKSEVLSSALGSSYTVLLQLCSLQKMCGQFYSFFLHTFNYQYLLKIFISQIFFWQLHIKCKSYILHYCSVLYKLIFLYIDLK